MRPSEAEWKTIKQVAELLQVNEETVRRWIRAGELRVLSLGSNRSGYRIRVDDLDDFLRKRTGAIDKATD